MQLALLTRSQKTFVLMCVYTKLTHFSRPFSLSWPSKQSASGSSAGQRSNLVAKAGGVDFALFLGAGPAEAWAVVPLDILG